MKPPLFDGYIMVDWSASSVPKTGKDSIWIATMPRGGALLMENPATRLEAYDILKNWLVDAATRGERWLVGFDFPFGYPAGTAKAVSGGRWADLWARIAELVEEGPKNANNRFDAAAKLNAAWPGEGPFWANGLKRDIDGLPRKLPQKGYGDPFPNRLRHVEASAKGTQETWKLAGAGSVGGQALTGIAMLERLRHVTHAKVWPFETMGKGSAHVLVEIFPSLLEPHPDEEVRDAGQVRAVVEAVQAWDRTNELAQLLEVPGRLPSEVVAEEGWILGAGAELKDAPRPTRRRLRYQRDPASIYAESFATVEAEARLDRFPEALKPLVTRVIHACGMVEVADRLAFSPDAGEAGSAALAKGAPVIADCEMVKAGIIRARLPGNEVVCTLNEPSVRDLAEKIENTRSAAAVHLWRDHLKGAVVAIGNAPTALFHLLELLDDDWPKPALILGFPVGFVGAAESKAELANNPRGVPFVTLRGRRGGSAMASAAVNALVGQALP